MKILFIENNIKFVKIVIKQFLSDYEVSNVVSVFDAKQELMFGDYDLILVDYDLDDGKGVEVVNFVKEKKINIHIIAVSSHEEGNDLLKKAGAEAICSKMQFKNINEIIKSLE